MCFTSTIGLMGYEKVFPKKALRTMCSIGFEEGSASSQVLITGRGFKGGQVNCRTGLKAEEGQQLANLIGSLSKDGGGSILRCNPAMRGFKGGRVQYPSVFGAEGKQQYANHLEVGRADSNVSLRRMQGKVDHKPARLTGFRRLRQRYLKEEERRLKDISER